MQDWLRLSTGRAFTVDAAAFLIALFAMIDHLFIAADAVGSRWWLGPVYLVVPVALLWRRRFPVGVVVAVAAPIAVQAVITGRPSEGLELVWPIAVALYSVGAYAPSHRRVAIGVASMVAAMAVHDVNDPGIFSDGQASEWAWAFWLLLGLVAPTLLGIFVGAERQRRRLRHEQIEAQRAHAAQAAAAVAQERSRIARELHDVVTHNVNVVVLQAMAASGVLDTQPERARAPLAAIEVSGREALIEMRRLLGMLSADGDEAAPLTPQPSFTDLAALVEGSRSAGLDVALDVTGDIETVPAAIALAVYRVAQEALTNVLKHAPGSTVTMRVACEPGAVEIEVVDSGATAPNAATVEGGGHGLAGLRERVALFGGHIVAAPRLGGGFGVWARLPVQET
jgi:signal transduction histidine kinase